MDGDAQLEPGDIVAGRYRVVRHITQGSLATVVEATLPGGPSRVALYVYPTWACERPEPVKKLFDAARAAALLASPHARGTYDVGIDERQRVFFAVELLEGETARELIQRRGSIPAGKAVSYIRQACEVLTEWHALGRVHGHLTCDELFLASRKGGPPAVKVLGLEGAKRTLSEQGCVGQVMGNPRFFSPEQIRGLKLDGRTDVYSLGVVLYEMLSGRLPHDGETIIEVLKSVMLDPPRPLLEAAPAVPAGLAEVVHRCLERELTQRVQGTAELSRLLSEFGLGRGCSTAAPDAPRQPS